MSRHAFFLIWTRYRWSDNFSIILHGAYEALSLLPRGSLYSQTSPAEGSFFAFDAAVSVRVLRGVPDGDLSDLSRDFDCNLARLSGVGPIEICGIENGVG